MNNKNNGTNGLGITASAARMLRAMMPQGVAVLCAVAATGCLSQNADVEEETVDEAQQAVTTSNALTNNALTNNALTNNALTNNALTNNALNAGALNAALADPNARELLKYIVSCALPKGSQVNFTVDSTSYTYDGEIGLVPKWSNANSTCDVSCQQLVSACVMSRVDFLGEKVLISVRGSAPGLITTAAERLLYPKGEGTYFGNIFKPNPERYACVAPGRIGLPRVCGPTTSGCVVEALGWCNDVCNKYRLDGSFSGCSNEDSVTHHDVGFKKTTYDNTVTVFLAP
jgi:hypothetical protein